MKSRAPLHGYNTNYRKEGELFHVQTEDLGPPATAVVTQVFSGGTILAIRRTPYIEFVDDDAGEGRIRDLMRRQHKMMLVALRDGTLGKEQELPDEEPIELDDSEFDIIDDGRSLRDTVRMERPPDFAQQLAASARKASESGDSALDRARGPAAPAPPPPPLEAKTPRRESSPPAPKPAVRVEVPVPRTSPPAPVIERTDAAKVQPPLVGAKQTRPLFSTPPGGTTTLASPRAREESRPPPPPKAGERSRSSKPSRAPRVFADVAHAKPGLGEEQIGERSLDEVILGYLADELED